MTLEERFTQVTADAILIRRNFEALMDGSVTSGSISILALLKNMETHCHEFGAELTTFIKAKALYPDDGVMTSLIPLTKNWQVVAQGEDVVVLQKRVE